MSKVKTNDLAAESTEQKAPESWTEAVKVYVGPSFEGVPNGTVYSNGIAPILTEEVEKHPYMEALIVPISKLAESQNNLRNPEHGLSKLYKLAVEEIAKEKKEG